ncbi:hypothetical protein SORBI_3008G074800 [Sorghum bicolor]|uniref:Alpha/beta hydrolase fold-3 domain-containing protein n=1 Tax=Sorghum bicolor TaxID=4558 RepID=A0A1B6PBY0_SORBI|nr:hypothetical protein SORBI_3008G074800 [Sorghum bicolor]
MASSKPSLLLPFPIPAPNPSDEVVREFGPLLRIYKSGRIERPLVAPPVDPGHDAATGVQSKDVHLGSYSARLYLPPVAADGASASAKLPVVVYVHGGGFVAESAASPGYHLFLNRLAAACPALVVSVDYRLAPEHPLPASLSSPYRLLLKRNLTPRSVHDADPSLDLRNRRQTTTPRRTVVLLPDMATRHLRPRHHRTTSPSRCRRALRNRQPGESSGNGRCDLAAASPCRRRLPYGSRSCCLLVFPRASG